MSTLTKYALLNAFTDLLQKKPFNQITIKEITDACGIARMTFYYHFEDIYDMLNWAIEMKLQKAVDLNFTYDSWTKGYENVFNIILEEKQFFLKVFPSIDRHRVELYLRKIADRYAKQVAEEKSKLLGISLSEHAKTFVAELYGSLMVTQLIRWLDEGMKAPHERLVANFSTLLRGSLESILKQAVYFKE